MLPIKSSTESGPIGLNQFDHKFGVYSLSSSGTYLAIDDSVFSHRQTTREVTSYIRSGRYAPKLCFQILPNSPNTFNGHFMEVHVSFFTRLASRMTALSSKSASQDRLSVLVAHHLVMPHEVYPSKKLISSHNNRHAFGDPIEKQIFVKSTDPEQPLQNAIQSSSCCCKVVAQVTLIQPGQLHFISFASVSDK